MKITQIPKLRYVYKTSINSFPALFSQEEITLFYLPELGNTGINFVNKFRKKNIFNLALIYPIYQLLVRKINAQKYIEEFKKKNPNVRIVRNYKNIFNVKGKINFIDLTLISELYYIQAPTYRYKALYAVLEYINRFIIDNNIKNPLIFYHGNSENTLFFNTFFKLLRKKQFALDTEILNSNIIGFYNDSSNIKLYPFSNFDKKNNKYIFKLPILLLYKKEVLNEINQEDIDKILEIELKEKDIEKISNEDILNKDLKEFENNQLKENLKNEIDKILNKDLLTKSFELAEKTTSEKILADNVLDNIYQILSKINPQKSFDENLKIIKEKFKDDKEFIKQVEDFEKYLKEINKKYNGAIDLDEKLINKFANIYYNPLEIIGTATLNIYNRQKTEFDEVLDNAMFDLIKSIEKDEEAGIQVLEIKSEIIDTNKDRLKVYKIKLKNKKYGYNKPYTIEIHVPYPVKDKYIKLGGNTYIMINQFYPKPILKVKPNLVRLYTHFNTSSVSLKTHVLNEKQGYEAIYNQFLKLLNKKIKIDYYNEIEEEKNKLILEKFGIKSDLTEKFNNKKIEINI